MSAVLELWPLVLAAAVIIDLVFWGVVALGFGGHRIWRFLRRGHHARVLRRRFNYEVHRHGAGIVIVPGVPPPVPVDHPVSAEHPPADVDD